MTSRWPPHRDWKLVPLKVLVPLLKYQQHHNLSTVTLLPSERSAASQSTNESLSLRAVLERVCIRGLGVWHHVSPPPPLVSFHHVAERGLEAQIWIVLLWVNYCVAASPSVLRVPENCGSFAIIMMRLPCGGSEAVPWPLNCPESCRKSSLSWTSLRRPRLQTVCGGTKEDEAISEIYRADLCEMDFNDGLNYRLSASWFCSFSD